MDDELEAIRARRLAQLKEQLVNAPQTAPPPAGPVALKDATFWDVIGKARVALVDFWAPWCGPCHAVAPIVEALAKDYAGRLTVGKVNVDECPQTAGEFGVTSIPTLAIFREGKLVDAIVGAVQRPYLEKSVQRWL